MSSAKKTWTKSETPKKKSFAEMTMGFLERGNNGIDCNILYLTLKQLFSLT